jgi:hypothetical protein
MAKVIRRGTFISAKVGTRVRHVRVLTVTTQNSISTSLGHGTAKAATRGASTVTRGTIFTVAA